MIRFYFLLIMMFSLAIVSMSCDTGIPFVYVEDTFLEKNFVWSDEPNQSFDHHVDSYYINDGKGNMYVVGKWRGKRMMAGNYIFIFMCCSKEIGDVYKLNNGIVLEYTQPFKMVKKTPIRRIGALKTDGFKVLPLSKNRIRLWYDEDLANYKSQSVLLENYRWLRFDVEAKNSPLEVKKYVGYVLPYLQSEKNMEAIISCLEKLNM